MPYSHLLRSHYPSLFYFRPVYQPSHPARPTNLLLPNTPSSHNLFQQSKDRQQIIPRNNSPLLHQGAGTTTLADELAFVTSSDAGNQPLHGHKPQRNAYALNGGKQNATGEVLSSNQNYYGREKTPGHESGSTSERRPLKDILADVLNDSRRSSRSRYSGEESAREEEAMKKGGYDR